MCTDYFGLPYSNRVSICIINKNEACLCICLYLCWFVCCLCVGLSVVFLFVFYVFCLFFHSRGRGVNLYWQKNQLGERSYLDVHVSCFVKCMSVCMSV